MAAKSDAGRAAASAADSGRPSVAVELDEDDFEKELGL